VIYYPVGALVKIRASAKNLFGRQYDLFANRVFKVQSNIFGSKLQMTIILLYDSSEGINRYAAATIESFEIVSFISREDSPGTLP